MKILLVENIPTKVKLDFEKNFEVTTVRDMQWLGKKNGELLSLMVNNKFDFFITVDKNLQNQQLLEKFELSIFVLYPFNNKHQTIQTFIEKVKEIMEKNLFGKLNEIKL
ncbi:MAG: hypothetical protein LH473_04345 [Chitinophagales bacterium]|nr:hypothetical protein [Chitinophagales bacterium]